MKLVVFCEGFVMGLVFVCIVILLLGVVYFFVILIQLVKVFMVMVRFIIVAVGYQVVELAVVLGFIIRNVETL
jgi:hypothetical protein